MSTSTQDQNEIARARSLAREYRAEKPDQRANGLVIIYDGAVAGWFATFSGPEAWCPGSLAVDCYGDIRRATGGNDISGAHRWEPI